MAGAQIEKCGSVLLSHPLSRAVPSAQEGLTTVFEMGTGVAPPLSPPQFHMNRRVQSLPPGREPGHSKQSSKPQDLRCSHPHPHQAFALCCFKEHYALATSYRISARTETRPSVRHGNPTLQAGTCSQYGKTTAGDESASIY